MIPDLSPSDPICCPELALAYNYCSHTCMMAPKKPTPPPSLKQRLAAMPTPSTRPKAKLPRPPHAAQVRHLVARKRILPPPARSLNDSDKAKDVDTDVMPDEIKAAYSSFLELTEQEKANLVSDMELVEFQVAEGRRFELIPNVY